MSPPSGECSAGALEDAVKKISAVTIQASAHEARVPPLSSPSPPSLISLASYGNHFL